jgi:hypothetical protein
MQPREVQVPELSASAVQQEVPITLLNADVSADLSTTAVQDEVPIESVSEASVVDPEGGYLELTGVQNLESETPVEAEGVETEHFVALKDGFEAVAAFQGGIIDDLNKMLEESKRVTAEEELQFTVKPIPGREFSNGISSDQMRQLERSVYEDGKSPTLDVEAVQKAWGEVTFANAPGGYAIKFAAERNAVQFFQPEMGQLPNGEYRATVRLPEGYWEGVKSAAEADHVSVEDWLTNELAQRLEDTFFGRR